MATHLEAALSYAAKGWAVFPLMPREKRPFPGSQGFKEATTDASTIESWWKLWPEANIGIATGQISGGLVVLDVDKKSGGMFSLLSLPTEGREGAYTVKTGGGGLHFYFRTNAPVRNKAGLLKGIDVRGDGGYVVAPPSVHESGEQYLLGYEDAPLLDVPQWLASMLASPPETRSQSPNALVASPEGASGDAIGEGGRNAYLTSMAGALRRKGASPEAIEAFLLVENEEKCEPPLPDYEVRLIAKSVSRYAPSEEWQEGEARGAEEAEYKGPLTIPVNTYVRTMGEVLSDKRKTLGLPTGIDGLDELLGGGKRLGELTVTLAVAKTGKSSLYAYLIWLWVKAGVPVGYASREMRPESEVLPNLLSIEKGESILDKAINEEIGEEELAEYERITSAWPLFFAHGYGAFPLEKIKRWVKESKAQGVLYFFVDHLHYCLETAEEWSEAVSIAQALKKIASEESVHIDLVVQPTKLKEGIKLGLDALRGGAGIGQALDNLILLEPTEGLKDVRTVTLDRARWPRAKTGSIYLAYDRLSRKFTEGDIEVPPELAPPPVRPGGMERRIGA